MMVHGSIFMVLFYILVIMPFLQAGAYQITTYVKINVENIRTKKSIEICGNKQPFSDPTEAKRTEPHFTLNYTINELDVCSDQSEENLKMQMAVATLRPHSIFATPASCVKNAQRQNASAILFLVKELYSTFYLPELYNDSSINITVLYVNDVNFRLVQSMYDYDRNRSTDIVFTVQHLKFPSMINGTIILLFFITLTCIILGGLWSGYTRKELWLASLNKKVSSVAPGLGDQDRGRIPVKKEPLSAEQPHTLPVTWISLCCWLGLVVAVLLLSYYFFDILVWFFIISFTMMCVFSTYACLNFIWLKCCGSTWEKYTFDFGPCIRKALFCFDWSTVDPTKYIYSHREVIFSIISMAISVTWCLLRKQYYANYLHLILAMMFCIYFIGSVRLASLKWITMLLSAMFIYDLFMVFITPLFSSRGCSVMVEAATGRQCNREEIVGPPDSSKEQIPVVFRVPDFTFPLLSCYNLTIDLQYPGGLLGFGDVLVPGLLVGYNFAFDLIWNVKYKAYFVTAVIGYALGIIMTDLALVLMDTAQPALVYLVPFLLIPTHLLAIFKKQWWKMWSGKMPNEVESHSGMGSGQIAPASIATAEDIEPLT